MHSSRNAPMKGYTLPMKSHTRRSVSLIQARPHLVLLQLRCHRPQIQVALGILRNDHNLYPLGLAPRQQI